MDEKEIKRRKKFVEDAMEIFKKCQKDVLVLANYENVPAKIKHNFFVNLMAMMITEFGNINYPIFKEPEVKAILNHIERYILTHGEIDGCNGCDQDECEEEDCDEVEFKDHLLKTSEVKDLLKELKEAYEDGTIKILKMNKKD